MIVSVVLSDFNHERGGLTARRYVLPFVNSGICLKPAPPRDTRSLKTMRRVIQNLHTGQPPGDLTALDNPSALPPLQPLAE